MANVLVAAPTRPIVLTSTAALMKPSTRETIVPLARMTLARPTPLLRGAAGSSASSVVTSRPVPARPYGACESC